MTKNVLDELRRLRETRTSAVAIELQADNQRYWADGVVPLARRQPSKLSAADLDAMLQRLGHSPEMLEYHVGELRMILNGLPEARQALARGQAREDAAPKLIADARVEWEKLQNRIAAALQRQAELLDTIQHETPRATHERAEAERQLEHLGEVLAKLVADGFSTAFTKRQSDRVERPRPLPLQPSLDDVQPEVASEPLEPRDEPWVPASSAREPEIEGVREAVGDSATACPGAGPRRKDGELVLNVDGAEVCIRTGVPKRARQAPPDVLAPLPEPEPMQIETDNPNEAIQ